MKLEKLIIKGFKSFANETVINFNEDVIGIVGPNGSGKSNIVDAVRWVLGEQKSKELRLEKMNNVIFNGTKKKRAGGMAQVSLVFQNEEKTLPSDFTSIEISRILYRSGESEYRLNGIVCRLKDITNLFIDTGIGSNSYAIIALGMVDDILQDKDNSRRKMFEQAAGISKYKKSKADTLRQLNLAENDLTRVEDLLFEYEKNLKSLEKQAKRTKKYFEIKETYKEASIELANYKSYDLKEKYKRLKSTIDQETINFQGIDTELISKEAILQKEKKRNIDFEQNLSTKQKDLNQIVGKLRGLENDKKLMAQRLNYANTSIDKNQQQIELVQEEVEQVQQQIESTRTRVEEATSILDKLELEVSQTEEAKSKVEEQYSEIKSGVDIVLKKQQRTEKEIFDLEKEQAIFHNQILNLKRTIETAQLKEQEQQKQFEFIQADLDELIEKEVKQLDYISQLEAKEKARKDSIEQWTSKVEATKTELVKANRQLDSKQNEYDLTKSLVENLEGFPDSIKFLNKNWKNQGALLSDILFCPAEYRAALETYLEPYLSYYIVQNASEAMEAIKLLGGSQKGRANFFMLDSFDADYTTSSSEGIAAIDVLEIEAQYKPLMSYLLKDVVIVEDIPSTDADLTYLKKDGTLIHGKNTLKGGSIGLFEGKFIGRKKNLEKLFTTIKTLKIDIRELSIQLKSNQENLDAVAANQLDVVLKKEEKNLRELSNQKTSLETKVENFGLVLENLGKDRNDAQTKIDSIEEEILEIKGELRVRQDALAKLKAKISANDSNLNELSQALTLASQAHNQATIAFLKQQNTVQSINQDLSFKTQNAEKLRKQFGRLKQEIAQSEAEIKKAQELETTANKSLEELYTQKEAAVKELNSVEHEYYQKRNYVNELEDTIRNLNQKRQQVQKLVNDLKDTFADVRLQITSISERLNAEFGVSINDLINQKPADDFDAVETQKVVDKQKNRLQNYGEINPMAVEAYDEMLIRYEEIVKQRDDILAAKTSLLQTIEEIETTATKQFNEAFVQVRENFIRVFRSLFTDDDTCDLLLLDPENPLDSNIEIIAKPKGKRPVSINQLSGGEKTLTATALLFSLYLLKPAPFCIFDEVDAPLDDANIDKFNNIIRDFSKDSQFIIVTHNKQTMAAVDTIYGVHSTDGISGVSNVDFRAYKHEPIQEKVRIN